MDDTSKIIENYAKICEFLLAQACMTPDKTFMDLNFKEYIGHYATITIEHKHGYKPYVRVYDCPSTRGHSPQNYFYKGDMMDDIKHKICEDRPTIDFMKGLVIGWHRYGIKETILNQLQRAIAEANEKNEAEKEIDNFVV